MEATMKSEPAPQKAHLDEDEQQEAKDRSSVTVQVVHEAIRKQGDEELNRPAQALAWSGLAAGFSMGMSLVVEGLLQAHLPNTPWRSLVVRLGYPFGFLMVVGGRQQLFTENTLSPIIPLLERRDRATFWKVMTLWAAVLVSNIAGAHIAAWVLSNTPAFQPDVQHAFQQIAREAVAVDFSTAILRGVFAGWLIAMMVWILAAMKDTRLPVILIMTYVIGLGGFTHIVAGSVEALFLVWNGSVSWWSYAGGYALPTLIGNVLGGIALVSALNHAQAVAGNGQSAARATSPGGTRSSKS
jgi:formate/nitrite transporter FocA (FNT family)